VMFAQCRLVEEIRPSVSDTCLSCQALSLLRLAREGPVS
jgi:hypothetical protein